MTGLLDQYQYKLARAQVLVQLLHSWRIQMLISMQRVVPLALMELQRRHLQQKRHLHQQ